MKRLKDTCQCERNLRYGDGSLKGRPYFRLVIRYKPEVVQFDRVNNTVEWQPEKEAYKDAQVEVSDDLKTLIVLFCGSLVPAGVLADKIEEEHPKLDWVYTFLRRWDQLEGET